MAVATLTPAPARAERWRAQVAGIIPRVSLMTTKGVISTDPLGVAGKATCRPFGDGLVSTHPIPFGNISLTAKTERNTSPFHGLHDGDKGGGFNPHPFARQAEPWLLAVSRVFMMTTKGVVLRDPLCRGQAEPPVEPFGDGVISTDTIPSGNLSLTAKTERKRNVRRFTSLHDDANQRRVMRRWFAQPFSHAHHKHLFAAPILLQCYMLHVTIRWFHIAQDGLIENI